MSTITYWEIALILVAAPAGILLIVCALEEIVSWIKYRL